MRAQPAVEYKCMQDGQQAMAACTAAQLGSVFAVPVFAAVQIKAAWHTAAHPAG